MRILHILDHSIPLHSGYTFRTAAILREQRALGWETCHLTSEKQINCNVLEKEGDGLHFYRTPKHNDSLSGLPVFNQVAVMQSLAHRLCQVIDIVKPDILHAQRLGITDKIVFSGCVPHEQVNRYYDLIDLLAYALHFMRLTELVTLLRPIEVMAQGKFFITSDIGDHKELTRDGETGVLFRIVKVADLVRKTLDLLVNSKQWSSLQAAGRYFVETERRWKRSVSNYKAVYGNVLRHSPWSGMGT